MTKELETGGPAYPCGESYVTTDLAGNHTSHKKGPLKSGMTTRTYAAIHLRVPMSEHDWLNEMIRESQRQELAKAAMQGGVSGAGWCPEDIREVIELADAMLAEQEKK